LSARCCVLNRGRNVLSGPKLPDVHVLMPHDGFGVHGWCPWPRFGSDKDAEVLNDFGNHGVPVARVRLAVDA
jgi:hypothetical protein